MSFIVSSYQLRVYGDSQVKAVFSPESRAEALAAADALMKATNARSVEVSADGHQSTCEPRSCKCKRQLVWLVTRADYDHRRLQGDFPLFPEGTPRRQRPSGLADDAQRVAA